jgi:hypothetical protein
MSDTLIKDDELTERPSEQHKRWDETPAVFPKPKRQTFKEWVHEFVEGKKAKGEWPVKKDK